MLYLVIGVLVTTLQTLHYDSIWQAVDGFTMAMVKLCDGSQDFLIEPFAFPLFKHVVLSIPASRRKAMVYALLMKEGLPHSIWRGSIWHGLDSDSYRPLGQYRARYSNKLILSK